MNVERFQAALPHELAHVTIALSATIEVEGVDRIITKSLCDLRNRLHACRRKCAAWDEVTVAGWWVIDAAPLSDGSPMWIVSAEMIVFVGDVAVADLRTALEQQWRQPGRASVGLFPSNVSISHNVETIVGRASSHPRAFIDGAGAPRPWPNSWVESLYGWLNRHRRNVWEYLRFNVQPAAEIAAVATECAVDDWSEHDAMPCSF